MKERRTIGCTECGRTAMLTARSIFGLVFGFVHCRSCGCCRIGLFKKRFKKPPMESVKVTSKLKNARKSAVLSGKAKDESDLSKLQEE